MTLLPWAAALLLVGSAGVDPDRAWPVSDHRVLSAFRPPTEDWGAGHRGIDLPVATGEQVHAVAAGLVGFVGAVAGKPIVTVLLADGRRVTYEPVRAVVRPGEPVAAGDVIGSVADAGGHCGANVGCLHLGLRSGSAYLDPRALLPRGPAVLKPWPSRGPRWPVDAPPRTSP